MIPIIGCSILSCKIERVRSVDIVEDNEIYCSEYSCIFILYTNSMIIALKISMVCIRVTTKDKA